MNKLNQILLFITGATLLFGCDEIIQLDPGQTDNKVVIDALLTNDPAIQYIRITRNTNFYNDGSVPTITNALVSITKDDGTLFPYFHYAGVNPDSLGFYFPQVPIVGEIGHSYTLEVMVDGQTYSAIDEMFRVLTIDSLSVRKDEDPSKDDIDDNLLYQVLFYASEPQDTKDYYLFEFLKDGKIEVKESTDLFISDDAFLAGKIGGLEFPYNYSLGDSVTTRIFSLSRPVYLFYSELANTLGNDGGMFSPPPANPRTNLSNGALGIFQVSAVDQMSILVQE